MNQYEAQWGYSADINHTAVSFQVGDVVWLDEATANWINHDSPGVLALKQKGGQPHVHRMITAERDGIGLRDIGTITEHVDDEPATPEPAATPAAVLLAEKHRIDLNDIEFAGDKITVADVKTHIGDVKPKGDGSIVFGATKSGKAYSNSDGYGQEQ